MRAKFVIFCTHKVVIIWVCHLVEQAERYAAWVGCAIEMEYQRPLNTMANSVKRSAIQTVRSMGQGACSGLLV